MEVDLEGMKSRSLSLNYSAEINMMSNWLRFTKVLQGLH